MRTLIVYASKHGTTADCAGQLARQLDGESILCRLGKDRVPEPGGFDRIVIGGSIHIGKIQKQITEFAMKHKDALLAKPLGLFICCIADGETAEQQLKKAFPACLLEHSSAKGVFGGAYKFSKMGWLNRKMIQMVEKQQTGQIIDTGKDVDKTRPEVITRFASDMKSTFSA